MAIANIKKTAAKKNASIQLEVDEVEYHVFRDGQVIFTEWLPTSGVTYTGEMLSLYKRYSENWYEYKITTGGYLSVVRKGDSEGYVSVRELIHHDTFEKTIARGKKIDNLFDIMK